MGDENLDLFCGTAEDVGDNVQTTLIAPTADAKITIPAQTRTAGHAYCGGKASGSSGTLDWSPVSITREECVP